VKGARSEQPELRPHFLRSPPVAATELRVRVSFEGKRCMFPGDGTLERKF
jgi:hypothetical protein